MKIANVVLTLILGVGLLLGLSGVAVSQTAPVVFVDMYEVGGLSVDGLIPPEGTDLVIPVRFKNSDVARTGIINAFKVISDPGVSYDSLTGAWNESYPWDWPMAAELQMFPPYFDMGVFVQYFDNGVYFTGSTGATGSGLPPGFEDIAYTITIWGVAGNLNDRLWLDSVNFIPPDIDPAWTWDRSEINVAWDGAYLFSFPYGPMPTTYCWPQPTVLSAPDMERVLNVIIRDGNSYQIDLSSVRVNGIPPYTEARLVDWEVITDVFLFRFLGASGFRPIPPEGVQSTYTVRYNYVDGTPVALIGDYVLEIYPADVTLDGVADIRDVQFMIDYLWHGGPGCRMDGEDFHELMDVDGSGRVDIQDALKVTEIVGF